MSWRSVARAAVEREASAAYDPADPDGSAAYAHDERTAIAIEGGVPAAWAAALTRLESECKPSSVAASEWREWLDLVWRRAAAHGTAFEANGWLFEEAFGLGSGWRCSGHGAPEWLQPNARIVLIDDERVVFECGGAPFTHWRSQ